MWLSLDVCHHYYRWLGYFQGMQDSSLNGYSYLRNLVHLPFYLQNHGLPKLYSSSDQNMQKKAHNFKESSQNNRSKVLLKSPSLAHSWSAICHIIVIGVFRRMDTISDVLGDHSHWNFCSLWCIGERTTHTGEQRELIGSMRRTAE